MLVNRKSYIASVSSDGRSVLVVSAAQVSLDVFRVDLATGRRNLFKRIVRTDPSENFAFHTGSFTPDGKYYTYSYSRYLAELYTIDGLR
jgi:Tol biopolymer transport system component